MVTGTRKTHKTECQPCLQKSTTSRMLSATILPNQDKKGRFRYTRNESQIIITVRKDEKAAKFSKDEKTTEFQKVSIYSPPHTERLASGPYLVPMLIQRPIKCNVRLPAPEPNPPHTQEMAFETRQTTLLVRISWFSSTDVVFQVQDCELVPNSNASYSLLGTGIAATAPNSNWVKLHSTSSFISTV